MLYVQIEAQEADLELRIVDKNSSAAFNITLPGTSVMCLEVEISKGSKLALP